MRLCRFQHDGKTAFGIIDDADAVTVIKGSPFENYAVTGETHALSEVKLLAPMVPPTFYAAGVNYREHVTYAAKIRGEEPVFAKEPHVGYRAVNALVAQDDPIVIPRDASELVQYEGELVAVIGRKCRDVPEDEALDYVFGYTIGNDVSERTWQKSDRTLWRAKNTDTFKPMGPWIVTDLDPDDLHVTITLNDRGGGRIRRQDGHLQRGPLHQRHEPLHDPGAGGHPVDGHGRRHREHEGRRRGGGGDQ